MYIISLTFKEGCDPRKRYRFQRVLAGNGFSIYRINTSSQEIEMGSGSVILMDPGPTQVIHAVYNSSVELPNKDLLLRIMWSELVETFSIEKTS